MNRSNRLVVVRVCLSIAPLLPFCGTPTLAQNATPLPPVSDGIEPISAEEALLVDAQHYAKDFNVSLEEAMKRLVVMAGTVEQVDAIEKEFGPTMSGVYFDNGPAFQLVVRVTDQTAPAGRRIERGAANGLAKKATGEIAQKARGRGVQLATADIDLAASVLRRVNNAPVNFRSGGRGSKRSIRGEIERNFDETKAAFPTLQALLYDEISANIVVEAIGVSGSREVPPQLAAKFSAPVEIKWVPNAMQKITLRGGAQLYYASANSPSCTTGFVGWAPPAPGASHSTDFGVFTAGHCVSSGFGIGYKDATGKMFTLVEDPGLNLNNYSADIRFLKYVVGLGAAAQFTANKNEAPRTLTGRRTIASTTGTVTNQGITSTATTGTYVCFYGMKTGPVTGQGCGSVTYNGYTYLSSAVGSMVRIKGTFACDRGDSGGPVFANTVAFGVAAGCVRPSPTPSAGNELDYTSMDAAYTAGYKLSY